VTRSNNEYGRVRGYVRLAGFVLRLLWVGLQFVLSQPRTLAERSLWRQSMCKLIARGMGLEIDVIGNIPASGMLVSNHLSYLDAVVLGSLTPAVFVAKAEVRRWPLIGWLTACGGTIYLKRESLRAAAEVNRKLSLAISEGLPVVLFPEGTTTGATEPLPFHPAMFEPVLRSDAAVWPAALSYTIDGSSEGVAEHVCYWGDMTFVPHVVGLMRIRNLRALVRVSGEPLAASSRAEAATMSHQAVATMLNAPAPGRLRVAATHPVAAQQLTLS
jgi:1-acyl-sn-glycerol-3-phosphate acyltransferase